MSEDSNPGLQLTQDMIEHSHVQQLLAVSHQKRQEWDKAKRAWERASQGAWERAKREYERANQKVMREIATMEKARGEYESAHQAVMHEINIQMTRRDDERKRAVNCVRRVKPGEYVVATELSDAELVVAVTPRFCVTRQKGIGQLWVWEWVDVGESTIRYEASPNALGESPDLDDSMAGILKHCLEIAPGDRDDPVLKVVDTVLTHFNIHPADGRRLDEGGGQ